MINRCKVESVIYSPDTMEATRPITYKKHIFSESTLIALYYYKLNRLDILSDQADKLLAILKAIDKFSWNPDAVNAVWPNIKWVNFLHD